MTSVEKPSTGTKESQSGELQPTRTYWLGLSVAEKAFVAAYIENSYSVADAAHALKRRTDDCRALLSRTEVRKAIAEVQEELDNIDFLNEKWVRAQLLKLYPKVIGEDPVPFVTNTGEEMEVRKFMPDIAMKIIEYVVPKNKDEVKDEGDTVTVNVYIPDNGRNAKPED